MKLYDYLKLMENGEELTVWDADFDTKVYFYADNYNNDAWNNAQLDLAKVLTIKKIHTNGVTVNLSEVIEKHMEDLYKSELFDDIIDIYDIITDINNILSGYVSEKWFKEFVEILTKTDK